MSEHDCMCLERRIAGELPRGSRRGEAERLTALEQAQENIRDRLHMQLGEVDCRKLAERLTALEDAVSDLRTWRLADRQLDAPLPDLVAQLRQLGVVHYKTPDLELVLGPEPIRRDAEQQQPQDEDPDDGLYDASGLRPDPSVVGRV